jgi:hypothetical protein
MKYYIVSDYLPEEILGGCEVNNAELAKLLLQRGHEVVEKKSRSIDIKFIQSNREACFIISNFVELSVPSRRELEKCSYIIYEHDHKYLANRNPAEYKGFRAPKNAKTNQSFYLSAKAVLCQSSFHADIMYKNLGLQNIVSVGGNLWSEEILDHLEICSNKEKKESVGILDSNIWHKNTAGAIEFCNKNNFSYNLVRSNNLKQFLSLLCENNTYAFFPKTPETLSRVACEARMMGMKVITNNLVAATKEKWFEEKGKNLINVMRKKRDEITNLIESIFSDNEIEIGKFYTPEKPLISVVMPAYNDEEYIAEALQDLVAQTYTNIEVIIVDDGSTDSTSDICRFYADEYDFISYHLKENGGTGSALNFGFELAKGDYGTWVSSDDRRSASCIEKMFYAMKEGKVDLAFTAYHSERFNRAWRSYTPDSSDLGYKWAQNGFIHDSKPSKKVYLVDNWVDINLQCCHSGVSFLFTMDLKKRAGEYLTIPGEDYHMEVKMAMLAKDNKVAYIDDVLGWHRFPPTSLTSTDASCVHDAENITKSMILHWKKTGEINA